MRYSWPQFSLQANGDIDWGVVGEWCDSYLSTDIVFNDGTTLTAGFLKDVGSLIGLFKGFVAAFKYWLEAISKPRFFARF